MAQNPNGDPSGNGADDFDDEGEATDVSVITSALDLGGETVGADTEPVSATAITGEMPVVGLRGFVDVAAFDDTVTQLQPFTAEDFDRNPNVDLEPRPSIFAEAVQQVLRRECGIESLTGESQITPEQAKKILAPAREGAVDAFAQLIASLGGSAPAKQAAASLGITEVTLRQLGLIILANDEVPKFQIRGGNVLAGIVDVARAFREVNPNDTESVSLLDFLTCPLRDLNNLSPVQALKAAHDLAMLYGGDTSQAVRQIVELAKKFPQGGMYALETQG